MYAAHKARYYFGAVALTLLSTSVLIGCSTGGDATRTAECPAGELSPTESVQGFLSAVQSESEESARKFLYGAPEISEEAWAELAERLDGESIDALKFTEDSDFVEAVTVKVTLKDGSELGDFQTYYSEDDLDLKCAAVFWGTYPEDSDAAASQPATL